MKITGEQVQQFWLYMSKKYKFEVVDKNNAIEMKLVAWALEQMGIMNEQSFLAGYSTTVSLGNIRKVYVPFDIGKGNPNDLKNQILICGHETKHVVQGQQDRRFLLKYLGSDTARAYYEMDALRVDMELAYFLSGKCPNPRTLANKLIWYSIEAPDRRTVEKHLKAAKKIVERGGVFTGISKDAIRWWKKKL